MLNEAFFRSSFPLMAGSAAVPRTDASRTTLPEEKMLVVERLRRLQADVALRAQVQRAGAGDLRGAG